MAFHTYQSNRLENLADRLAELLQQPLHRSALSRETIVVQSNGMARWLTLRLAEQMGICANLDFQFPATFLWNMARVVLRYLPPTSSFDKPVMIWRVMALLQGVEDSLRFAPVRAWLGDSHDDFRRYDLACRIADCFDQYLVYRPDWIQQWQAGGEDHWQAELWRQLARDGQAHRVKVQEQFHAALRSGELDHNRLPGRVAIIGVAALPPLYLEALARLAHHTEVHLFVLNPCQEYWGDIQAERDLARLSEDTDPREAYLTVGNPLLASLGKQGRDFIDLLHAWPRVEWDGFAEPDGVDLLHRLQSDILHLRERGSDDCPAWPLQPDDRSIQIHICHGPMREIEVLHDQLLALFENHRDLRPSDVIVMTPDIATYGPLIDAVFSAVPRDRRIPFTIADQGIRAENPLVEAFFALLDLGDGRFDAHQVLSLLETPAVRRRFNLDQTDLDSIQRWTRDVGIRWGKDAAAKTQWGLPNTAEHTWQAGLDRLLLGYALPGHNRDLYDGILPYDEVEGDAAQALGQWLSFVEALYRLDDQLREPRSVSAWITTLHALLDQFFAPWDREESELQIVRLALEVLLTNTSLAQFIDPVGLEVVKSALRHHMNAGESVRGRFLSGSVTFCAMVPMRSIPFAVVGLIGMNDDAYPRAHQPISFDLMARSFRRGDRSRRQDDRYLFLETLLSARCCLYLSYVGQSIRDNTALPPSVLVSELLDAIDRGFYCKDNSLASEQIITRHPLQAFSRRYFTGDMRLFSYSRELAEASRCAGRGDRSAAPLLTVDLPEPEAALRIVTLEGLLRFFRNPAQWLLQERLGIRLNEDEETPATREPFVLNGLENYNLLQQMLELFLEGRPLNGIEAVVRGSGALPHAQVGECVFAQAKDRVVRFAGRLGPVLPRGAQQALDVDLALGPFRLTGRLTGMTSSGVVGYRLASLTAHDYLSLWLRHVVLNSVAPADIPLQSYWLAEDQQITLQPLQDPQIHLQILFDLYWQGTQHLLHFFPKSALKYTESLRKGKPAEEALRAAQQMWEGSDFQASSPESANAYYQLAFRETDPLDAEFTALAQIVFMPIFDCRLNDSSPS